MITRSIRANLLLIYIVCASLFITGCQAQRESQASTSAPAGTSAPLPGVPGQASFEQGPLPSHEPLPVLVCAHPENCPASVGELMSYEDMQLSFCTVSLVAPDVVLTASHCVPKRQVGLDRKIRGNCWIRFPAVSGRGKGEAFGSESVSCTELLDATELTPSNGRHLQADYAYLRLAHSLQREPLRIAERGANVGKARINLLYGIRLMPELHSIDLLSCARDDAFDLGQLSAPRGQALVMPSCAVRPGFSGGPILDPLSHEIVAVVSGVVGYDAMHPDVPKPSIGTRVTRPSFAAIAPRAQVQLK